MTAAQGRCLCAERDLLGDHEEPCAGFGTRSDELCEQAEREAVAAGEWPPESPAAQDQDVALVSHALDAFQGGGSMREAADAALARIDQRLAAGAAMAAVVDECVKAGHITAVPS